MHSHARSQESIVRTKISGGTVETEIYTTEGGYVAITQPSADTNQICLLSADQLPQLIRELQALYDDRRTWQEAAAE
jgi:hypothetical protein